MKFSLLCLFAAPLQNVRYGRYSQRSNRNVAINADTFCCVQSDCLDTEILDRTTNPSGVEGTDLGALVGNLKSVNADCLLVEVYQRFQVASILFTSYQFLMNCLVP